MSARKPSRRRNPQGRPAQSGDSQTPKRTGRKPLAGYRHNPTNRPAKATQQARPSREKILAAATGKPLFVLQTQPGLGSFVWNEAKTTLDHAILVGERHIPDKDDTILIQADSPLEQFLELRTAEDAFVVAARIFNISNDLNGLKQIYAGVTRSEMAALALKTLASLQGRLPKEIAFRLIARTTGKQQFTRKAMGKAVSDAVEDKWPGDWKFVEEGGTLEIWATLFGTELIVALRLSAATMRHRGDGRAVNRPAALRPAVAATMVRLTNPSDTDVFLDPMAGTGTIVAERAAAGGYGRLIAGDRSRGAVAALTKNLQDIGGDLAIRRLDSTDLPFKDGEITKIATNLPFGRQVSHPDELILLYQAAFAEWERIVAPGGLIVALADDIELVRSVVGGLSKLQIRRQFGVTVLGHKATIFQIERKA